ncbi:MAG: hypothetical protein WD424_07970 [Paenibacillaceae bacterium]
MNNVTQLLAFAGFIVFIYIWRWIYTANLPATWDQVDFVLAIDRFDLLVMQPHFPGYPYYILGGMIAHRWILDPGTALIVFNLIVMLSSIVPIYALSRRYTTHGKSLLIIAGVHSTAYLWILSAQPMAETSALALLCWYWWSLSKAMDSTTYGWQLFPLFVFSLIMGIRLSYLAFGFGIVLLWVYDYLRGRVAGYSFRRLLFRLLGWVAWALLFQSIWVIGLIMSAGNISGFIQMAMAFTGGHFHDWGGTASFSVIDLLQRLYTLIVHNLLWTGLTVQSISMAALLIVSLSFIIYKSKKVQWSQLDLFARWFVVMGVAYLVFAWLAQNIDKPRHIAPLILMTIGVLSLILIRNTNEQSWKRYLSLGLIHLLILTQASTGAIIVKQQSEEQPAVYQLAERLQQLQTESELPIMVYTWEETRVFEFLQVEFNHKRIYTFPFFLEETKALSPRRIFITGQALDGFIAQGAELEHQTQLVEVFHSDTRFDPVYAEIRLYEWLH